MMYQIVKNLFVVLTTVISLSNAQTPDPMCPYPSEELVYFPYPGDCTKYWECFEGNKYLYTCPPGLWWHEEISECDYPGDFCDNSTVPTSSVAPTEGPTPVTTGSPDPMCQPPSSTITYFPYPGDCTKYIECFEGDKYIRNCPNGLWWHEEISECDYPGDFCTNSTIPTSSPEPTEVPTTKSTGAPDEMCQPASSTITYFPYPGDCTKYIECFEGDKYIRNCPNGLWWHEEISECDYPGDFCDPSNTTVPTPTPAPTSETTPDFTPDPMCPYPSDKIVYFPYPGDCTKYWECFKGHKYLYTCPNGLWWHEEISECDNPGDFCDDSNLLA